MTYLLEPLCYVTILLCSMQRSAAPRQSLCDPSAGCRGSVCRVQTTRPKYKAHPRLSSPCHVAGTQMQKPLLRCAARHQRRPRSCGQTRSRWPNWSNAPSTPAVLLRRRRCAVLGAVSRKNRRGRAVSPLNSHAPCHAMLCPKVIP